MSGYPTAFTCDSGHSPYTYSRQLCIADFFMTSEHVRHSPTYLQLYYFYIRTAAEQADEAVVGSVYVTNAIAKAAKTPQHFVQPIMGERKACVFVVLWSTLPSANP